MALPALRQLERAVWAEAKLCLHSGPIRCV